MKTIIYSFLIGLLFFSQDISAQNIISGPKSMSLGTFTSFSYDFNELDAKFVKQNWKIFANDNLGKTKKDRKSKEFITPNASVLDLNSPTVYAFFTEKGDGVTISTWYQLDKDFIDDSEMNFNAVQVLLLEFALFVEVEKTKEKLNNEQKALHKLENNLEKLAKKKEGYEKTISISKDKIVKAEENIVQNEKEQANAKKEIENQKNAVKEIEEILIKLEE